MCHTIQRVLLSALAIAALFPCAPKANAADAPAWMHALTTAPLPKHDEKTGAVGLYREYILVVQPNGKIRRTERAAYKILRPNGRYIAKQYFYMDDSTRVTHIHGWCIPAQGKDYEVKEKDVAEKGVASAEDNVLYADYRMKVMDIPAPDPGNIIGYEVETEEQPYILQDEWRFQEEIPVADTRYILQLPAGWEYKAVWVNHSEIIPTSLGGNQWQWQVKDVPDVKPEERMPPWRGVAGLMIISLIPQGGNGRGFLTWSDMGAWYSGLVQGRREPSPELKQKVVELTAQLNTPLAKMQTLADFTQKDIRYVEISLGIGGVQPHPARDVFSNRYGDCKDKVTLLSSMLKEVGIDSYYVVINVERGGVTSTTPPHIGAFNHMIIAIRLPDDVNDPSLISTIQDPKLGKLLIFDPTDEYTHFGSLFGPLQANYGLLVTPDGGQLIQMPQLPPRTSGTLRTAQLVLDAQGSLRGQVQSQQLGDSAWYARGEIRNVEKDSDRIKPIERVMTTSVGSFTITKASMTYLKESAMPFILDWSFVADSYAKPAGDLLLVRPRVIGVDSSGLMETKEPRAYPVELLGPHNDRDTFEITMPAGYVIDELPPPTDVDYPFGSYHSKTVVEGNTIKYTRTYEIKQVSIPVSQAEDLKKFFRIIGSDERNTAVLKPAVAK
jgi:hypothetical protein